MRSEKKTAAFAEQLIGERIPCRDARQRVWQALDLLRNHQLPPSHLLNLRAQVARVEGQDGGLPSARRAQMRSRRRAEA
jgi:hypothetical protein